MNPRIAIGLAITAVGVVLAFMPHQVGEFLGRPTTTNLEIIEARVSVGGLLTGIGLSIAAIRSLRPRLVAFATLALWMMVGFGGVRILGFVVDGDPDGKQWFWLAVEAVIFVVAAWYLRRARASDA